MNKKFFSFILCILAVIFIRGLAYAQLAPAVPKVEAKDAKDKALGGKSAESAVPASVAFWATTLPQVTGKLEQRYDINRDGILQTSETKIFLRDVMAEIKDKNSFNISDSVFLKAYDKNKDGIVSKLESLEIKKDLEY